MPEVTSATFSVKEATVTGRSTSAPVLIDHVDRRAAAAVEDGGERQPRHPAVGRPRQRTVAVMPNATLSSGSRDGEARRVGAGRGVGLRRELAQPGIEAAAALRPQLDRRGGLARLAEPGLRQRHHGFLLAVVGEPRHRLADGDDLAGLGQGRGDHAVGVGLEVGIAERIAGEVERALGALRAGLRPRRSPPSCGRSRRSRRSRLPLRVV